MCHSGGCSLWFCWSCASCAAWQLWHNIHIALYIMLAQSHALCMVLDLSAECKCSARRLLLLSSLSLCPLWMDLTLNCLGNCRTCRTTWCCYMMDHMHFNSVLQTVTPIRMREVFVIMFVNLSRSVRASALSLGSRWNNWLVLLSVLKGHSVHLHW